MYRNVWQGTTGIRLTSRYLLKTECDTDCRISTSLLKGGKPERGRSPATAVALSENMYDV
jgi:hypothetical protein